MLTIDARFEAIKSELRQVFRVNIEKECHSSFLTIAKFLNSILIDIEINPDQFSSIEPKIKTFARLGFMLVYTNFGLNEHAGSGRLMYTYAKKYFDEINALLPALDKELAGFYTELMNISLFFTKTINVLLLPQQRQRQLLSLNNATPSRIPLSAEEIRLKMSKFIESSSSHSRMGKDFFVTASNEWNSYRYMHRRDFFQHPYFKANFSEIIGYLYRNYLFIVFQLEESCMTNVSGLYDEFKHFFTMGCDLIEIYTIITEDLKEHPQRSSIIQSYYKWKATLEYIDPFRAQYQRLIKDIQDEIINSVRVKNAYFKPRTKVIRDARVKFIKPNKNTSRFKTKFKAEKKDTAYVNETNAAYALYRGSKFKEAIKSYENILLQNKTITKHNRLKQVEISSSIGDCYKYWAKSERDNKVSAFILGLEKKAMEYYHLAEEQIRIGLNEFQDQPEMQEWLMWLDFNNMSIESLNPKNYLSELKYEIENNANVVVDARKDFAKFSSLDISVIFNNDDDIEEVEFPLDEKSLNIGERHHAEGYTCYVVGGAIRDFFLPEPVPSDDIDVATTAHPHESKRIVGDAAKIVNIKSPLVRMDLPNNKHIDINPLQDPQFTNNPVLVTLDNQALVAINPTDLVSRDCLRRDFPCNALYWNMKTKKILDPTGRGLKDIENKILTTIIDPIESFTIDPLRMFRLIRFKFKLGFSIDPDAEAALIKCQPLVKLITPPVLLMELHKLLFNHNGTQALSLLNKYKLLNLFYEDENPVLDLVIADIVQSKFNDNTRWLLFLAGLLWPSVEKISHRKMDSTEVIRKKVNQIVEQFHPFLFRLDLKIKQIWLQAISEEIPPANLTVEEYGIVDIFKKNLTLVSENEIVGTNKSAFFPSTAQSGIMREVKSSAVDNSNSGHPGNASLNISMNL